MSMARVRLCSRRWLLRRGAHPQVTTVRPASFAVGSRRGARAAVVRRQKSLCARASPRGRWRTRRRQPPEAGGDVEEPVAQALGLAAGGRGQPASSSRRAHQSRAAITRSSNQAASSPGDAEGRFAEAAPLCSGPRPRRRRGRAGARRRTIPRVYGRRTRAPLHRLVFRRHCSQ